MEPDFEAMLRRVVERVFESSVEVRYDVREDAPHIRRATLSAGRGSERRTAGLEAASTGIFGFWALDLGVSAFLIEYDDEAYMEEILIELALVAKSYLCGEGRVEMKRGWLRTSPVLRVSVNGNDWEFERRSGRVFYPKGDRQTP